MREKIKNILINSELDTVLLNNQLYALYPKFQIDHRLATIDNTIMVTFYCDSGTESYTFDLPEIKKEIKKKKRLQKLKYLSWKK